MAKLAGLKIPLMMNECIYTPFGSMRGICEGRSQDSFLSFTLVRMSYCGIEAIRNVLIEHYGVNTRYEVITNIVDLAMVKEKMVEPVEDVSFDRFTFVNLARFDPQKDHTTLVEAFRILDNKDTQLLLLGQGQRFEEIKKLVRSFGLEKNILLLGFQRNPFKYLSRAGCFVFSSVFEGQGQVMMEAMACGLPVISTDCEAGPRELLAPGTNAGFVGGKTVEQGEYGVLVPVGNAPALAEAMREMMDSSELQTLYKQKGYERVKGCDMEVVLSQIRPIMYELLGREIVVDN